jgi:methionyl-tRNA synthetase
MSKPFYLTTPLYYVNAPPSWGAYTNIVADAIKRHKQMLGVEVFLTTGTDEHGQKIERSAKHRASLRKNSRTVSPINTSGYGP